MKQKIIKSLIIAFAVLVILSMVFGGNFFFKIKTGFLENKEPSEIFSIKQENLFLKGEILRLEKLIPKSGEISPSLKSELEAYVYASYPFSDKSRLTINKGSQDSVEEKSPIVFQGVLLGQIFEVFPEYSSFRTLFEPGWEFPVYIGKELARGLYKGGLEPKVELISKKLQIEAGDLILTADPKLFPPGLIIGKVSRVEGEESSPFWSAPVAFSYNLNEIRKVNILSLPLPTGR
ncbi:MAG: hypothetical protein A2430_00440 [Candidatus Liptonbacteria bacterium RIFOXYC1_FULL_36_8]|uniref:Cell shape-determining protein MreC n=3 Tax=Candidatus Liptoniibacteriota TaxID=1817909 RepID=A0A1G2CNG9_9BACT|nr:MAG: hypothetical protein A2390_02365 [Candidatus Liptonbacteria bacterium RIFOXYB1_FULL_36_10]OGZ04062.1 MAG: hypothetical protein A2430_00440 [Candidatus Liptonbacteria bacterium RIFOXYC1_FULL_36_8]OGZ04415.1 MAG: hypothetical protein A2604_02710 [Candidatus Liptonbacteria bacterium RIFOXYD1_FULL_36_11]